MECEEGLRDLGLFSVAKIAQGDPKSVYKSLMGGMKNTE